jgi:hypothetical protein
MDSAWHAISGGMWNVHNSSWFESYGLTKLEDLICWLESLRGQRSQSD